MSTKAKTIEEEYAETFKKGTIVEVSSEDQGLRGSWYTATVIRTLSRTTRKMLVEYHNLMADESGSKKLREMVDAVLIRPIPPIDPGRVFRVMEDVDAFHNDGWWEGVVTHVHDENNNNNNNNVLEASRRRYSVFFRCSREQIEFSASDMRLHREWVRGNLWVPPLDNNHHSTSASPSPGRKRKNGEDGKDGRNGGHAGGGNSRGVRNGEGRGTGKRSINSLSKQGGGGGGVVMKKQVGGERKSNGRSNRLVSNGVAATKKQRVSSNGVANNSGVTKNGTLKEPRRRATNHKGHKVSRR